MSLYYSKDGGVTFSPELRQVAGDVKDKVRPGTNKKINWAVAKELAVFDGDMVFKVEANSKRIGYPKPVSDELFSMEISKVSREGSHVRIEFRLTNISDKLMLGAYLEQGGTTVLDDQGAAFASDAIDVKIANKKYFESIEFSKDVAYKGFALVKNVDQDMPMLSLLTLGLLGHRYSIKNIPISK